MIDKLLANVVTFDTETTTTCKGNPFNHTNSVVTMQTKVNDETPEVFAKQDFSKVPDILQAASIVVGANLKFDLHWLQRELGIKLNCVWDVQLAEFILSKQQWKYPDLATMCDKYGVTRKLDVVKNEYWDKGIDTDQIPFEVLAEYGAGDVQSTYEVFLKQVELFRTTEASKFKLFRLHCNDLLVLQEMEYNGIVYDTEASLAQAESLTKQVAHLESKIHGFTDGVPLNLSSRDHISVLLYGGVIKEDTRLPIGVYKTGAKVGQTRYKIVEKEYTLPRLVQPLKGSEMQKEGYFSTDETTLLSLKPNAVTKKLIGWLLERSKLMKLKSTYLEGLPKIIAETGWSHNMLHSNLNQCQAGTGRLSSTKPNQQNLNPAAKKHCVTRF